MVISLYTDKAIQNKSKEKGGNKNVKTTYKNSRNFK